MTHHLSWLDRLRIERVVWMLDQRLYDLPSASRVAKRREVRENLMTAAGDVGTSEAIRNLGNPSQLAAEYLSAELGDQPRHSWIAALLFAATTQLIVLAVLTDAAKGFGDGIVAADPRATGTFHWDGLSLLQSPVTYTLSGGDGGYTGGGLSLAGWALWIIGAIIAGRLWRHPLLSRLVRTPAARSTR